MKSKTKRIIFELTLDEFIILRGALNKFQIDRIRTYERMPKSADKLLDRKALMLEANTAKNLFDAVDRQWNDYEVP